MEILINIVYKLLNSLVNVFDINDIMKTGAVTKNVAFLWRHEDVSTENNISNTYKEEALISNDVLGPV